ncbi:hypothetical protein V8C86DRAFT_2588505, partial [Haematococcus lacustris]
PILVDVPVSNHGARVRFVLYKKGLAEQYDIKSPADFGGLKSPTYLELNAQGKMPVLIQPGGLNLPESEVIVQYLLDKWQGQGPSLPPGWAQGALITRIHDLYIAPVQGCMYRVMDDAVVRAAQLAQIAYQLGIAVIGEVQGGLDSWEAQGRWRDILDQVQRHPELKWAH